MKEYEVTVLLHPDLEIDLEAPLTKVRAIVTSNGGEVVAEDNWGKRRLAYRISEQDFAIYVFLEIKLPAASVKKVDTTLNITDEVLRHLIVSVDPKVKAALAESKEESKKRGDNDNEGKGERRY